MNCYPRLLIPCAAALALLTFSARGEVIFVSNAGDNTVQRVGSTGVVSPFVTTGLNAPQGIVFDAEGNAFISNATTVVKVPPGGSPAQVGGTLNGPTGLAFDAAGSLYVAVSGDSKIVKLVGNDFVNFCTNLPSNGSPQG